MYIMLIAYLLSIKILFYFCFSSKFFDQQCNIILKETIFAQYGFKYKPQVFKFYNINIYEYVFNTINDVFCVHILHSCWFIKFCKTSDEH